ncbi:MAG: tRNA uridine-5-carboxymethylaminomethyl(34) synthesis GTPase MnmE [Clostridiales bacterium]|nr:tRNA uridine-5-carboxymethylaminomethyl(34) synthesis GTPase MnmE [Clostridiales bacterium]
MSGLISSDTIAAQATASGEGGIAIVRLSGAESETILARVFRAKNGRPLESRVLTFGHVLDGDMVIDEAMAVLFRAPYSYTREDVVEIHCHGSDALVRRILLLLLRAGARMARPGEFTCRAFLNGRIDLAQAEAVMRMIRAGSERAMTSAIRQMEGGVSSYVAKARGEIVALLAEIAAAIDFPDEIEETQTAQQIHARCGEIAKKLQSACDPRAGRIEDEGLRVVLCGRPNAGKSSLLNALIGGDRAIVTDIPGTTRDTLTESMQIAGLRVLLTDTAGLRETGDAVERIGVERAHKALDEADVRVLVLDSSCAIEDEDRESLCDLAPHVVVLSKGDLAPVVMPDIALGEFPQAQVVTVCAPLGEGLDALKALLVSFAPEDGAESSMLSQARHVQAALRACDSLLDAQRSIDDGMTLDMCAVDLSAALDALGEITGETMSEQVIGEVFARFCVGK